MSASDAALEVIDLTVRYGKRVAVDGLSLQLRPGELVALLGPNGAGKSTSLLAMAGAILPSAGQVHIGGSNMYRDPLAARAQVGFADQPPSLYEFFTVAEHLEFIAETRGDSDTGAQRQILTELGLGRIADRLCRELSFGMRQRVGLAAALVGNTRIVLLDETLNGLDPRAAKSAREVLRGIADSGAAVLMSTHLLGVAEHLCKRVLIMDKGSLEADVQGNELDELLSGGPGAIEELYLSLVTDVETT